MILNEMSTKCLYLEVNKKKRLGVLENAELTLLQIHVCLFVLTYAIMQINNCTYLTLVINIG